MNGVVPQPPAGAPPAAPPPAAAAPAPAAPAAQPTATPSALAPAPVQTVAPAKPGEQPAPAETPAPAPAVVVDAKWRPKVIEGKPRDEAVLTKTAERFAKLGLNADQAQALIDYSDELAAAGAEAQEQAAAEAGKKQHADWWKQLQDSKELGGTKFDENKATWGKAASALLTPAELKQIAEDGLANYPPLVHALFRAGSKISEDTLHDGNRPAPAVPTELQKMKAQYPKSPELWDPNHPEFTGARK